MKLDISMQWALPKAMAPAHRLALPRHAVIRWVRRALQSDAAITVRIVDADEGRALNQQYRHKDYATNVLTFDYAPAPQVEADLVLCAPVVETEARQQGKTLQDHYTHLIIHGVLHAQGYDHETSSADARAMEALEVKILAGLGLGNPY